MGPNALCDRWGRVVHVGPTGQRKGKLTLRTGLRHGKRFRLGPAPDKASRPFWLLAILTGSGTLGVHIFAPALPLVAREFDASTAGTQLTVSLYIIALAVGQVVYGPISDRLGRRPVLIGGLALYIVAGALSAVAPSLAWLLAARVLQAFGGCAGLVLGRAIVQDTARGLDAASAMARLNVAILAAPAIAPIIGVWLGESFGWRSIPVLLSLVGTLALLGTVFLLSETVVKNSEPARLSEFAVMLRNPRFSATVVGGALATGTLFALYAVAPFVLIDQLDRPFSEIGFYFSAFIAGIATGSLLANRFVRTIGFRRLIAMATLAEAFAGLGLLALVLTDTLTVATFVGAGVVYSVMAGVMGPLSLAIAAGTTEHLKGSATGVYGFTQMSIGAACVTLAGIGSNPTLSLALVLAFAGTSGFLIFAVRRHLTRVPPGSG